MVSSEVQNIREIVGRFKAGIPLFRLIDEGYFRNNLDSKIGISTYSICPHCGSRYKDPEKEKEKIEINAAYRMESARLLELFKDALFIYHDLDPNNKKVQKAFEVAYNRGHGSGYSEIASEFLELIPLIT